MNKLDIQQIKDYIIQIGKPGAAAYNLVEHQNLSREEILEQCENYFYEDHLGWCECGDAINARLCIRNYLRALSQHDYFKKQDSLEESFGVRSIYDNQLLLCLAYALDSAGLTEHGSSIGGAWLTKEGEMFLWLLERNEKLNEELVDK